MVLKNIKLVDSIENRKILSGENVSMSTEFDLFKFKHKSETFLHEVSSSTQDRNHSIIKVFLVDWNGDEYYTYRRDFFNGKVEFDFELKPIIKNKVLTLPLPNPKKENKQEFKF